MTIQQLKYIIKVAETGSITEAAKALFISQSSLYNAIREIEKETRLTIFTGSRQAILLTKEGLEFLGYARNVVQQMELLEDKFVTSVSGKIRFAVSTQHYTFTSNAFVEMIERFGQERYEFILNETQTRQIMDDVKNRFSDLGVLFISRENEAEICRELSERRFVFHELFSAKPHAFMSAAHPLAAKTAVSLEELKPYPRLNFIQGNFESSYWSEEPFSSQETDKHIRISDRGAIVNLMIGMNAYTISSGIFPSYLQGNEIIAIPVSEDEVMHIGYITNEEQTLSELGKIYVEKLLKYGETLLN
jgi:DNA-binding transcriptional LysR family regulator